MALTKAREHSWFLTFLRSASAWTARVFLCMASRVLIFSKRSAVCCALAFFELGPNLNQDSPNVALMHLPDHHGCTLEEKKFLISLDTSSVTSGVWIKETTVWGWEAASLYLPILGHGLKNSLKK